MLRLGKIIIDLTLFANFMERMGGIGVLILIVGGIIISWSNMLQILGNNNCKQSAIRLTIQLIVGAGMVLFGIYVIYESLTLQLP